MPIAPPNSPLLGLDVYPDARRGRHDNPRRHDGDSKGTGSTTSWDLLRPGNFLGTLYHAILSMGVEPV